MTRQAASPDTTSSLRRDVERLALPSGRRVGTTGHEVAVRQLVDRLVRSGLEPYGDGFALPYRDGGTQLTNLVGVAAGADRTLPPVLIGAHFDTAGDWPGADDNAAAVAIAFEVARRFVQRPAARDLLIALFDAEEPPYFHTPKMGSSWFHAHQARGRIHAALVLDLVGHAVPIPGAEDVVFMTGMESDPGLERTVRRLPAIDGVRPVTAHNRYVGDMSDHHTFRLGEVPYLFLSCGRWQHYHQPSDTSEKLAYPKMAATADLVEGIVRDLAVRPLTGPWEGYDTTATDLATMRAGLAPALAALGEPLETRADIDRVTRALMSRFLL